MKLSSISLTATALAVIAGSATATPGPEIYSRGMKVYPNYRDDHQLQHHHTAVLLDTAYKVNTEAANCAHDAGWEWVWEVLRETLTHLEDKRRSHFSTAQIGTLGVDYDTDRKYAVEKEREGRATLKSLRALGHCKPLAGHPHVQQQRRNSR